MKKSKLPTIVAIYFFFYFRHKKVYHIKVGKNLKTYYAFQGAGKACMRPSLAKGRRWLSLSGSIPN